MAAYPDFKVDSLIGEVYYVTFTNGMQWQVPVYLSALGIFPPPMDFCYPGSHHSKDHPDYLERESLSTSGAWYKYNNYSVRLLIDKEFNTTGKYTLEASRASASFVKYAQLRTEKERNDVITAYLGQQIQGEAIMGEVINIFCRWKSLPSHVAQLEFFDDTAEALEIICEPKDVIIHIHDLGSHIEFELPLLLIRKI